MPKWLKATPQHILPRASACTWAFKKKRKKLKLCRLCVKAPSGDARHNSMFAPNYSTLKKYTVHYWHQNTGTRVCLLINAAGQKENVFNLNGVSWWTRLPTGVGEEGEMSSWSKFWGGDWRIRERDAQHDSFTPPQNKNITGFPACLALGNVSFPGGCLTQPFSLSTAFVLPCFNRDTVNCSSENPGLIPAAELQQPKHPSVLSTVILSWIWTCVFQTKASISHHHDLCQPGLPLNLFPLNLQGRK